MQAAHDQQTEAGRQSAKPLATAQLRADFADARKMMVECGEWSVEQSLQIGLGIAEAVKEAEAGEYGMLRWWCDWFAIRGEAARALRLISQSVIDTMRRAA